MWTRVVVSKVKGTSLELSNLEGPMLLKIRPGLEAKLVMSEWAESTPCTLLELLSRKVGEMSCCEVQQFDLEVVISGVLRELMGLVTWSN